MMDKSFEKQMSDKLNNIEVQPSDGLLESIFEKRAARPRRFAGIGYSGLVLAIITVSVAAFSFMLWNNGEKLQADMAMESSHRSEVPAIENSDAVVSENQSSSEADAAVTNATSENSKSSASGTHRKQTDLANIKTVSNSKPLISKRKEITAPQSGVPVAGSASEVSYTSDPAQYFNIESKNRPVIDRESHKGRSHLYVYQTIGDQEIADRGFLFSRIKPISKIKHSFTDEENQMVLIPQESSRTKTAIQRNPIFVDMLYSPSLSMLGTPGKGDLQKVNNTLSRTSYNYQFGVRVSVPVSKQFSVFTGTYYRSQSNSYKGDLYYNTNETRVDRNVRYINDPVLGVIQVVSHDTVNYTASNRQNIDHRNTYTLLQLPLGLSYNYGYKNFDFAFHASALINVFRTASGHYLDLEKHQTKEFKSESGFVGVGAGFSWMAAYKVSPKFRLIMEPGIQYLGINSLKAGNNIKENALIPQLSLGLRYTIF